MSGIRHIAVAAGTDTHFLTAEFEHRVQVWSFAERTMLAELDTPLDFGGHRLALCGDDDTPLIVAGAWERHGVNGYAPDGTHLWQRKDLKRLQHLAPAAGGSLVVAGFESGPAHVLSAESGTTVATVRALREFHDSPFADVGLGELSSQVVLVRAGDWKPVWKAPLEGFALLSAAAAPGAFAYGEVVSDGNSLVTCRDLGGERLWQWTCRGSVNCPALAWDAAACEWLGVLHNIDHEQPDTLVRWSADGEIVAEHPLDLFAARAFLPGGHHLVTSDGAVRETSEGSAVWNL